ncbi:hypothetical protein D7Z26_25190 [Cohnella endophytica]|uniref:Uncharacterized protein n=1 Tax=Cohnella endophytica TaxID=2419778 RepID=A0A494X570_9BACL|nr:hypothetical protein [Cohnella endophytica]RKP45847.1 hypothetical protein D7Z26_25190 [Cohnella endophytica]
MLITWLYLFSSLLNGGSAPAAAAPVTPLPIATMPGASPAESATPWQLQGIRLGETASDVKEAWGTPANSRSDLRKGCETWNYKEGTNVGLCEGSVANYIAEDGWGIVGDNGEALKVFKDKRGNAVSLDLFFAPCGI